LGKKWKISSI